jgi:hypothetical protein
MGAHARLFGGARSLRQRRVEAHAFYQRAGYAFVKTQHRFRKEVGR